MNTRIFHSVNSGLYLTDGTCKLWVDGIYDGSEQGFSPMPALLRKQLREHGGLFSQVTSALFTHLHGDHFQREGLSELLCSPRPPKVYGPGLTESSAAVRALHSGVRRIFLPGVQVLAIDTIHDGTPYRKVPHQSYLLYLGGEAFFMAGDAALTPADAADLLEFHSGRVAAGFFNLYQLVSAQGQAFIRLLKPERIFLIHLPFREDDCYHYRSLARQAARNLPEDLPRAEIFPHMSWVHEGLVPD